MNKEISVAIIEDEYPSARLLAKMIRELRPHWVVSLLPGSIEEATNWFASHVHPHLLFLDIRLTDGNSFYFIEKARPQSFIIFTTAYDEYAVKAFSVNSIDYLLKPISTERLENAILKYENILSRQSQLGSRLSQIEKYISALTLQKKIYRTRFLISYNGRLTALQVEDIAYFFSEEKQTYAMTKSSKKYIVDLTLNRLEEELNPDDFFRVNRQFILSIGSIKKLEPYFNNKYSIQVFPKYDGDITVSREKISLLKEWLNF